MTTVEEQLYGFWKIPGSKNHWEEKYFLKFWFQEMYLKKKIFVNFLPQKFMTKYGIVSTYSVTFVSQEIVACLQWDESVWEITETFKMENTHLNIKGIFRKVPSGPMSYNMSKMPWLCSIFLLQVWTIYHPSCFTYPVMMHPHSRRTPTDTYLGSFQNSKEDWWWSHEFCQMPQHGTIWLSYQFPKGISQSFSEFSMVGRDISSQPIQVWSVSFALFLRLMTRRPPWSFQQLTMIAFREWEAHSNSSNGHQPSSKLSSDMHMWGFWNKNKHTHFPELLTVNPRQTPKAKHLKCKTLRFHQKDITEELEHTHYSVELRVGWSQYIAKATFSTYAKVYWAASL